MESLASLLPFLLIIAVFWFLVIRPARNQQKRLAATQASVSPGTEVMLGSGFYGRVVEVGDETLRLELAPGTEVTVARQAVVKVLHPEDRPVDGPVEEPQAGETPDTGTQGPQA